jgi:hypothetical protein
MSEFTIIYLILGVIGYEVYHINQQLKALQIAVKALQGHNG